MFHSLKKINPPELLLIPILITKAAEVGYIYIGSPIYPRGDSFFHAGLIVLTRKNIYATLSFAYPKLFCYIWAIPLYTPLVNNIYAFNTYLLALFFFNALASVTIYYTLAKKLFKDIKIALYSTAVWNFVSGFTWLYRFIEPLSKFKEYHLFLLRAVYRVGCFSGAYVSHTYIGGHILARLTALNLFLASTYFLVKYLEENKNRDLALYTACFTAAICGHVAEGLLIGIATLSAVALTEKVDIKKTTAVVLAGSLISLIFLTTTSSEFFIKPPRATATTITCFSPLLGIYLGILLKKIRKWTLDPLTRYHKHILGALLYIYGLSIIAFTHLLERGESIAWAEFTHWYIPPVEWGFTGLLAVISALLIVKYKWYSWGLKFTSLYLLLQGIALTAINIFNITIAYIAVPVYIEPVYSLVFLAMIAGHLAKLLEKDTLHKIAFCLIFVLSFSLLAGDTVMCAEYWRYFNGRIPYQHVSWGKQDLKLLEYLYKAEVKYGRAVTPQLTVAPSGYIIHLAGLFPTPQAIRHLYLTACSWKELYLLYKTYPIDYIVVDRQGKYSSKYTLLNLLKQLTPVYVNTKYLVYKISSENLTQTKLPEEKGFIACEKILFNGTCISTTQNNTYTVKGQGIIEPLDNGWIKITNLLNNTSRLQYSPQINIKGTIILTQMYALEYFKEIRSHDQKLAITGEIKAHIFNTFCNKRIYLEKFNYNGNYSTTQHYPTAKDQALKYYKSKWISPVKTAETPEGILWTLIYIIALDITLLKKYKKPKTTLVLIKTRQIKQSVQQNTKQQSTPAYSTKQDNSQPST